MTYETTRTHLMNELERLGYRLGRNVKTTEMT